MKMSAVLARICRRCKTCIEVGAFLLSGSTPGGIPCAYARYNLRRGSKWAIKRNWGYYYKMYMNAKMQRVGSDIEMSSTNSSYAMPSKPLLGAVQ